MPFVGKKFNNSFFSKVGIGHGSLKNSSNGESANFTPYMGEIEYQGEKLWGSFKLNKDSVTEDINFPGGLDHFLTKNQYLMSLLYVHKKFRIRFTNKYTFISDQNERFYEDIDLKYNISRDGHWILVGLGGSYYWNKKDIEGYWTPKRFISYGPRFESTWAIKDKNFIYMSGNINLFYDETSTSGTGYYLNVAYQRGKRNDCNMKLGYERIQSKQKTGKWFMDRPYVNLTCFW